MENKELSRSPSDKELYEQKSKEKRKLLFAMLIIILIFLIGLSLFFGKSRSFVVKDHVMIIGEGKLTKWTKITKNTDTLIEYVPVYTNGIFIFNGDQAMEFQLSDQSIFSGEFEIYFRYDSIKITQTEIIVLLAQKLRESLTLHTPDYVLEDFLNFEDNVFGIFFMKVFKTVYDNLETYNNFEILQISLYNKNEIINDQIGYYLHIIDSIQHDTIHAQAKIDLQAKKLAGTEQWIKDLTEIEKEIETKNKKK